MAFMRVVVVISFVIEVQLWSKRGYRWSTFRLLFSFFFWEGWGISKRESHEHACLHRAIACDCCLIFSSSDDIYVIQ